MCTFSIFCYNNPKLYTDTIWTQRTQIYDERKNNLYQVGQVTEVNGTETRSATRTPNNGNKL